MSKKVYIGVGHGGKDPGAVANGIKEKDANLTIAKACRDELKRHGVEVKMSRSKDIDSTLADRISECNEYKPDVALDIHNNAGGGDGAECFHHIGGGVSKELAKNILECIKAIGQNSRGAKTKVNKDGKDYYGFIRQTFPPSVVLECCFLDNKKDVQIINTSAEQKKMGVAIAKGILKTLGILWKPETTSKPTSDSNTLYRVQVGSFKERANAEKLVDKLKEIGIDAVIVKG